MTSRTSAPEGVARHVVRGDSRRGGTGRHWVHIALCCVLIAGFQGATAGSAAVATLPDRLAALAPVEPVQTEQPFNPSLNRQPGLFTSILKAAFPVLGQRKPASVTEAVEGEDMNEPVRFGQQSAPRWLVQSILKAARTAGVDPGYMMVLADVESSLSPTARARTSSAEGLFQFIDRTWLETVYTHAADYGYRAVADAIEIVDGEPELKSEKDRAWVLGLRRDPYFSALMAGELIKDIARELQGPGERELAEAELYLAHFLGATNAVRFLQTLDEAPNTPAAKLFPQAARANAGLFTEGKGRKRRSVTVAGLYEKIDTKIVRRLDRFTAVEPLTTDVAGLAKRGVEVGTVAP
ncbi:transglycosylase SLT domain-containing protein [Microvirga flavescens]|uniref:transglycosylase SLT domain-containing protein n=1 Tax=Microvirga flavescens TaxID=2249811 RepID=UPI000DD4FDC3|nr:transglycosylase SLT domain-containing protein [Microvirga flavescens]